MGREFELKFAATQMDHEVLKNRYGHLSPIAMETRYYDTPAGDLSRLRWTLRCESCPSRKQNTLRNLTMR